MSWTWGRRAQKQSIFGTFWDTKFCDAGCRLNHKTDRLNSFCIRKVIVWKVWEKNTLHRHFHFSWSDRAPKSKVAKNRNFCHFFDFWSPPQPHRRIWAYRSSDMRKRYFKDEFKNVKFVMKKFEFEKFPEQKLFLDVDFSSIQKIQLEFLLGFFHTLNLRKKDDAIRRKIFHTELFSTWAESSKLFFYYVIFFVILSNITSS